MDSANLFESMVKPVLNISGNTAISQGWRMSASVAAKSSRLPAGSCQRVADCTNPTVKGDTGYLLPWLGCHHPLRNKIAVHDDDKCRGFDKTH